MLYCQPKRPVADEALKQEILKVMEDNPSYGHKRIALELRINKKRVRRTMKKFHLMPKRRRKQGFVKVADFGKRIHTVLKTAPVKFRLDREYLFKELGT